MQNGEIRKYLTVLGNLDTKYMHGMNSLVSVYDLKITEYTGYNAQNSRR